MNKQELLVHLADQLSDWPSKVKHGPIFSGWTWFRDSMTNEIKLGLDVKFERPQIITETEWRDECMNSLVQKEPVEPTPVEAMIDIETFDTEDSAVMFQAAVILFDEDHNITYRQIWNLDFDEQFKAGRTISASTVAFHLKIPENALASLNSNKTISMRGFTSLLIALFKESQPKRIWAKGDMDFKVLKSLFATVDRTIPWTFRQPMELRTLMRECDISRGDVSHNALEDCVAQVKQLAECRAVVAAGKNILQLRKNIAKAPRSGVILDPRPEAPVPQTPQCLYTMDQGVTDSLPHQRVAYRADCGYQRTMISGYNHFPEGNCPKCVREILLEHDVKDLLEARSVKELGDAVEDSIVKCDGISTSDDEVSGD